MQMTYHKWANEAFENTKPFLFLGFAWNRDLYQWSFEYGKTRADSKTPTEGPDFIWTFVHWHLLKSLS